MGKIAGKPTAGLCNTLEPYLSFEEKGFEIVPYSGLQLSLKENIAMRAKAIAKIALATSELAEEIREAVKVRSALEVDVSGTRSAAVDAGVNGKDLLVGFCPVVVAVGSVFDGKTRTKEPLAATSKLARIYRDEEEGKKLAGLFGFYMQFELARKLVGDGNLDLLIVDGPLAIRRSYYSPSSRKVGAAFVAAYEEAQNSLAKLLVEARDANISVVGLVKRVRSSIISRKAGLKEMKLLDSMLSSIILSRGEHTSPLPLLRPWNDIPAVASIQGLNVVGLKPNAVFVKPNARKTYRLEIPEYALNGLEEVVGILAALSEPKSGLPLPLVDVDRLSRITQRAANSAYLRLFKEVMLGLGPAAANLLSVVTFQHGEV